TNRPTIKARPTVAAPMTVTVAKGFINISKLATWTSIEDDLVGGYRPRLALIVGRELGHVVLAHVIRPPAGEPGALHSGLQSRPYPFNSLLNQPQNTDAGHVPPNIGNGHVTITGQGEVVRDVLRADVGHAAVAGYP